MFTKNKDNTDNTDKALNNQGVNLVALTVYECSSLIRSAVNPLKNLTVKGEVCDVACTAFGIFFSLKDEKASIRCIVWNRSFKSKWASHVKNGIFVIVKGDVALYIGRSLYQINVYDIVFQGTGIFYETIINLKKKMQSDGLFDADRKRPIPQFPRVIGLITSIQGAVVKDIIKTLRWPCTLLIFDSLVQGEKCVESIKNFLRRIYNNENHYGIDVLIIARGGGSEEDLIHFSDESLCYLFAQSPIPTISAIGHEVDWALIDYVSDKRAPTPTAVASLFADKDQILEEIHREWKESESFFLSQFKLNNHLFKKDFEKFCQYSVSKNFYVKILHCYQNFQKAFLVTYQKAEKDFFCCLITLQRNIVMLEKYLQKARCDLDSLVQLLLTEMEVVLKRKQHSFHLFKEQLNKYSNQDILDRGYAVVSLLDTSSVQRKLIKSFKSVSKGDNLCIELSDGVIFVQVHGFCPRK